VYNTRLSGFASLANLVAADVLLADGTLRRPPAKRAVYRLLLLRPPFREMIGLKRWIQYQLGLG
jgi:hypothetical protein